MSTLMDVLQSDAPWSEKKQQILSFPFEKKPAAALNDIEDTGIGGPGTWDEVIRGMYLGYITAEQLHELHEAKAESVAPLIAPPSS